MPGCRQLISTVRAGAETCCEVAARAASPADELRASWLRFDDEQMLRSFFPRPSAL